MASLSRRRASAEALRVLPDIPPRPNSEGSLYIDRFHPLRIPERIMDEGFETDGSRTPPTPLRNFFQYTLRFSPNRAYKISHNIVISTIILVLSLIVLLISQSVFLVYHGPIKIGDDTFHTILATSNIQTHICRQEPNCKYYDLLYSRPSECEAIYRGNVRHCLTYINVNPSASISVYQFHALFFLPFSLTKLESENQTHVIIHNHIHCFPFPLIFAYQHAIPKVNTMLQSATQSLQQPISTVSKSVLQFVNYTTQQVDKANKTVQFLYNETKVLIQEQMQQTKDNVNIVLETIGNRTNEYLFQEYCTIKILYNRQCNSSTKHDPHELYVSFTDYCPNTYYIPYNAEVDTAGVIFIHNEKCDSINFQYVLQPHNKLVQSKPEFQILDYDLFYHTWFPSFNPDCHVWETYIPYTLGTFDCQQDELASNICKLFLSPNHKYLYKFRVFPYTFYDSKPNLRDYLYDTINSTASDVYTTVISHFGSHYFENEVTNFVYYNPFYFKNFIYKVPRIQSSHVIGNLYEGTGKWCYHSYDFESCTINTLTDFLWQRKDTYYITIAIMFIIMVIALYYRDAYYWRGPFSIVRFYILCYIPLMLICQFNNLPLYIVRIFDVAGFFTFYILCNYTARDITFPSLFYWLCTNFALDLSFQFTQLTSIISYVSVFSIFFTMYLYNRYHIPTIEPWLYSHKVESYEISYQFSRKYYMRNGEYKTINEIFQENGNEPEKVISYLNLQYTGERLPEKCRYNPEAVAQQAFRDYFLFLILQRNNDYLYYTYTGYPVERKSVKPGVYNFLSPTSQKNDLVLYAEPVYSVAVTKLEGDYIKLENGTQIEVDSVHRLPTKYLQYFDRMYSFSYRNYSGCAFRWDGEKVVIERHLFGPQDTEEAYYTLWESLVLTDIRIILTDIRNQNHDLQIYITSKCEYQPNDQLWYFVTNDTHFSHYTQPILSRIPGACVIISRWNGQLSNYHTFHNGHGTHMGPTAAGHCGSVLVNDHGLIGFHIASGTENEIQQNVFHPVIHNKNGVYNLYVFPDDPTQNIYDTKIKDFKNANLRNQHVILIDLVSWLLLYYLNKENRNMLSKLRYPGDGETSEKQMARCREFYSQPIFSCDLDSAIKIIQDESIQRGFNFKISYLELVAYDCFTYLKDGFLFNLPRQVGKERSKIAFHFHGQLRKMFPDFETGLHPMSCFNQPYTVAEILNSLPKSHKYTLEHKLTQLVCTYDPTSLFNIVTEHYIEVPEEKQTYMDREFVKCYVDFLTRLKNDMKALPENNNPVYVKILSEIDALNIDKVTVEQVKQLINEIIANSSYLLQKYTFDKIDKTYYKDQRNYFALSKILEDIDHEIIRHSTLVPEILKGTVLEGFDEFIYKPFLSEEDHIKLYNILKNANERARKKLGQLNSDTSSPYHEFVILLKRIIKDIALHPTKDVLKDLIALLDIQVFLYLNKHDVNDILPYTLEVFKRGRKKIYTEFISIIEQKKRELIPVDDSNLQDITLEVLTQNLLDFQATFQNEGNDKMLLNTDEYQKFINVLHEQTLEDVEYFNEIIKGYAENNHNYDKLKKTLKTYINTEKQLNEQRERMAKKMERSKEENPQFKQAVNMINSTAREKRLNSIIKRIRNALLTLLSFENEGYTDNKLFAEWFSKQGISTFHTLAEGDAGPMYTIESTDANKYVLTGILMPKHLHKVKLVGNASKDKVIYVYHNLYILPDILKAFIPAEEDLDNLTKAIYVENMPVCKSNNWDVQYWPHVYVRQNQLTIDENNQVIYIDSEHARFMVISIDGEKDFENLLNFIREPTFYHNNHQIYVILFAYEHYPSLESATNYHVTLNGIVKLPCGCKESILKCSRVHRHSDTMCAMEHNRQFLEHIATCNTFFDNTSWYQYCLSDSIKHLWCRKTVSCRNNKCQVPHDWRCILRAMYGCENCNLCDQCGGLDHDCIHRDEKRHIILQNTKLQLAVNPTGNKMAVGFTIASDGLYLQNKPVILNYQPSSEWISIDPDYGLYLNPQNIRLPIEARNAFINVLKKKIESDKLKSIPQLQNVIITPKNIKSPILEKLQPNTIAIETAKQQLYEASLQVLKNHGLKLENSLGVDNKLYHNLLEHLKLENATPTLPTCVLCADNKEHINIIEHFRHTGHDSFNYNGRNYVGPDIAKLYEEPHIKNFLTNNPALVQDFRRYYRTLDTLFETLSNKNFQ
jgi:hypothetical protein